MIIWGGTTASGFTDTGASYNPISDSWAALPAGPSARTGHTSIWAGVYMIVWGGWDGTTFLNTGSDSTYWRKPGLPLILRMQAHLPVEKITQLRGFDVRNTNTDYFKMVIFGGRDASGFRNDGGAYDMLTNTWDDKPILEGDTADAERPSARILNTVTWSSSRSAGTAYPYLLVWGGYDGTNYLADGGRYDYFNDNWLTIDTADSDRPSARAGHTAVSTLGESDSKLVIWGGWNGQPISMTARSTISARTTGHRCLQPEHPARATPIRRFGPAPTAAK